MGLTFPNCPNWEFADPLLAEDARTLGTAMPGRSFEGRAREQCRHGPDRSSLIQPPNPRRFREGGTGVAFAKSAGSPVGGRLDSSGSPTRGPSTFFSKCSDHQLPGQRLAPASAIGPAPAANSLSCQEFDLTHCKQEIFEVEMMHLVGLFQEWRQSAVKRSTDAPFCSIFFAEI